MLACDIEAQWQIVTGDSCSLILICLQPVDNPKFSVTVLFGEAMGRSEMEVRPSDLHTDTFGGQGNVGVRAVMRWSPKESLFM